MFLKISVFFYKNDNKKKYDKLCMIEERVQSIGLLEYLLNSMMENVIVDKMY